MSAEPSRLLSVTTPLGPDAFLLTGFSGVEGLSRLFRFELELLSEQDVSVGAPVGGPIAWAVRSPGRPPRFFHGVVRRFAAAGREVGAYRTYRAVVVPWVWAMTRGAESRAFADRTLPEIVEELFRDHGFADYELQLSRPYTRREHRIQYRESPFQFVSRLLAEEGAFYFFRHEEGGHRLVIADGPAAYRDCEERQPRQSPGVVGRDRIAEWEHRCEVSPGAWTPIDDDGELHDAEEAPAAQESMHEIATGSGGCCTFTPGGKFALEGGCGEAENSGFVIVAVEHAASDPSFTPAGGGKSYVNRFTCIPDTATFRPGPTASRPVVAGPQIARVAGPTDGEPCDNEGGLVAVRFLWGRERRVDKELCRVRVAGEGRDGDDAFRPQVGQEVLVHFLDGDPDCPQMMVGDSLRESPAARGASGLPAGADMDRRAGVLNDDELTVGNDQTIEVRKHRTVVVKEGGDTTTIEKGDRTAVVSGDDRCHVKNGDREVVVEGGHDIHVVQVGRREVVVGTGDDTHRIGKGDRTVVIEGGDDALTIKKGNQRVRLDLGRSVTEAAEAIELRVGPSVIRLEPSCVTIEGMAVTIEGHAQAEVKGLMTRVGADAVLAVQGGATVIG